MAQTEESDSFRLIRPLQATTSVVFSSAHSGRDYPDAFLRASVLGAQALRSSEDAYVDRLFARAPLMGAPLILARAPRAYVDLNRGADELDPAVVEGVLRPAHNPRISSGLGVIPRVVAGGRAIYSGKLPLAEARARLDRHWHPWHERLRGLLSETHRRFGEAILFDCHSMPHEAIESHGRPGQPLPEVVLGDRFGAAAGREIVEAVEAIFRDAGFRTARNSPFAGAYIAQAYGRPSRNQHVVQIEIDRALYMDEATIQPRADFAVFHQLITDVISRIASGRARNQPLAAE